MRRFAVALLFVVAFSGRIFAQAGNASLTGSIQDSSKAFVPGVRVLAVKTDTNQQFETTTNKDGSYSISSLPVGPYRMQVEKVGFRTILKEGLFLHTQDVLQINFEMAIGSTSEAITVTGEAVNINTTDATVGTVIDRKFVEDIPLNGRSFQSLILLSPGVVTASPQGSDNSGEFSVNGQRTSSNNFMLDGASASNAPSSGLSTPGSAGSASNSTAIGTTQAIISVEAMQEFRISTSTYSAEFGRMPGAQISFTSRSGTNEYHGTAFDYLRNYALDANNWFNNASSPALPRPAERQNDFGGVFGGPLRIPKLFSGENRVFFFFSYEGLRLTQPSGTSITYVPSNGTLNTATNYASPLYKNLRANAPAALQAGLNGFPLPNCSTAHLPGAIQNAQCIDYGDGLLPFIVSTTLPSSLNSLSGRIDYQALSWLKLFARYADTESSANTLFYGLAPSLATNRNRIFLLGADAAFGASLTNQLRIQYSPASNLFQSTGQSFGGVTSVVGPQGPNLNTMEGLPAVGGKSQIELGFTAHQPILIQSSYGTRQFQSNAVDTVSWMHGRHFFKTGVDYRQTTAYLDDGTWSICPQVFNDFGSASAVLTNVQTSVQVRNGGRQDPTYKNLGLYAQDEWRIKPRVTLSLGLRWDLNPPATISGVQQYTYTGNILDPFSVALSKLGAPLYKTTYTDFAPRVGVAATLINSPGHELVFRAGGGLFYDTGQAVNIGMLGDGVGLGSANHFTLSSSSKAPFPLPTSMITAPPVNPPTPPYTLTYIVDPHFVPPSTVQWSTALEQALGPGQTFTVSYVGTAGRNLSILQEYSLSKLNPLFSTILEYANKASSNYNALQVLYKRRMAHGLQVQSGYTWSHSLDDTSTDYRNSPTFYAPQKGNSDHDVRQNFTTALVYSVPTHYTQRWVRSILGYWNVDLNFLARSGFPFNLLGATVIDPVTGDEFPEVLNWNGQNPYVYKAGIPAGRQLNLSAFSVPLAGQNGNDPRNFLRGFGATEASVALQREFPLRERVRLQFRVEAFNVANHPIFGAMNATCGTSTAGAVCNNPLLGQASGTLSNAPVTGLSSIYNQGGPRSLQLALKLQF